MECKIKSQLRLFKLFYVASRIVMFTPIYIIFYQSNELSMSQITMLKAVTFITVILFEIPSGALADTVKKKNSLFISMLLFSFSCLFNIIGRSFFVFAVGSFFWGCGIAFLSGADSAWLYEYLERNKLSEQYSKINGELNFSSQIINSILIMSSSLLFEIHIRAPYIVNYVIFIFAAIMALFLWEKPILKTRDTSSAVGNFFNKYKETLKLSLVELKNNKELLDAVITSAVFMLITIATFETYQIFMAKMGIDIRYFGIIYFLFIIVSSWGSKVSYLFNKYSYHKVIYILFIVHAISIFFMSQINSYFGIVLMIIQEIIFGIMIVLMSSRINNLIKSKERATILSFSSLITNVLKSLLFPILGYSIDHFNLNIAYYGISFILIFSILLKKRVKGI